MPNERNFPRVGIDRFYVDSDFLDEIWIDLKKKIPLWLSGLEQPTKAEQMAYIALKNATLWTPPNGDPHPNLTRVD